MPRRRHRTTSTMLEGPVDARVLQAAIAADARRLRQGRSRRALPTWSQEPLDAGQMRELLAAHRQYDPISLYRAMGRPFEAPIYNPRRGSMARSRRRRNPSQAKFPFAIEEGPMHGPYEADQYVTYGRRARGRGKARVYGPVQDASAYRSKPRRKSMAKKRRAARRRTGTKRRTAAQRAATRRMLAANRRRRAGSGKRRGKARRSTKTTRRTAGRRRTAAQRAATRKMLAANRRRRAARRRTFPKGFKTRRKAANRRRKRGSKNLFARRTIRRGEKIAGLVRRNPGGRTMARYHRRRRRNPGLDIMGTAKRTIAAAIPAVAGGAIASILEGKFLANQSQAVQVLGKVGLAAAAAIALRSRPNTAALVMGGILGSVGSQLGAKLMGGMVTTTKTATQQALARLVYEDPAAMSALIDASGQAQTIPSLNGLSTADVNLG